MKKITLIFVLYGLLITAVQAGFDEGLSAYDKKDYKTALKEWETLAKQGHVSAQFYLGVMYANGLGVKQDYFKAVEWYTKAAKQGHASAQYNLGVMYANGQGVKQDYFKAVEWAGKACDNRNQLGCDNYKKYKSKVSK